MRGNGAGLCRGWGERADKGVREDERGTAAEDGRHVARGWPAATGDACGAALSKTEEEREGG